MGNPQSYNRYSYCLNNPLKYTDPSGHSIEDYVLGSTGLAGFVASSRADAWAKTVGNRSGNLGFKSFADAENSLAEQKDPMGLNADTRFAKERAEAVSVTAQAAVGMAKTEIAVEAAIVAPEAKAVLDEVGGAKVLTLDGDKYPVSASNLEEAGAVNKPLTVNRAGAAANRADALQGLQKVPGRDLDEAPPAMFRKPGDSVVVRPTPPGDNRGAGASLGNQSRGVPEGGKVVVKIQRKESQ